MPLKQVSFFKLRFVYQCTLLFHFHMEYGRCQFLKCMFYIPEHSFIYFNFQCLSCPIHFLYFQFINNLYVTLDFILNFSKFIIILHHFLHFNFRFNYLLFMMSALHIHLLFQLISNSLNHCANFLFHTISIRILHVFSIHKFDYYSFLLDPIIYYH